MFAWLKRRNGKREATPIHNPCVYYSLEDAANSGFYIGFVGKQLEEVASALGMGIRTRFNLTKKCGELYNDWGVIARVYALGECGGVYGAVVTSWLPLPETKQDVFKKAFGALSTSFEPIAT